MVFSSAVVQVGDVTMTLLIRDAIVLILYTA